MAQFAIDEHNRCKRLKVRAAHFASDRRAYDLRFFWVELLFDQLEDYRRAGELYLQVGSGKYGELAARYVILAFDKQHDTAAVVAACDRYVKLFPDTVDAASAALTAAQRTSDDDRFAAVVRGWPESYEAHQAADALIEPAVRDGDWDRVSAWSEELLAIVGLGPPYYRAKLVRWSAQADIARGGLHGTAAARVLRAAAKRVPPENAEELLRDAAALDPRPESAMAVLDADPSSEGITEAIERLERAGRMGEARQLRAWLDFLPKLEPVEEPAPEPAPEESSDDELSSD